MFVYGSETYEELPTSIRLPDGRTRTALNELLVSERDALGLYEYTTITPEHDPLIMQWSGGYTIDAVNKTATKVLTNRPEDSIKADMVNAIQNYLDTEAKAHYYDGILSLCSYATSTNPKFGPEGRAAVVWRDACWATGYAIMAEVEAQTRSIPTIQELLSEMPSMVWP